MKEEIKEVIIIPHPQEIENGLVDELLSLDNGIRIEAEKKYQKKLFQKLKKRGLSLPIAIVDNKEIYYQSTLPDLIKRIEIINQSHR